MRICITALKYFAYGYGYEQNLTLAAEVGILSFSLRVLHTSSWGARYMYKHLFLGKEMKSYI